MKTKLSLTTLLYLAVLSVSIFALNIEAQTAQEIKEKKNENLIKNCYNALTHSNAGVVESAIFVSIQFKNKFPDADGEELIEALDEIASESKSAKISYKAQLAKMYFNNSEWFKNVEVSSIKDEQKVYENIAETLSSIMFATDM